jgi:hypothetical protein
VLASVDAKQLQAAGVLAMYFLNLRCQVVPVALRSYVPFFPLDTGVLGVTLWKEFCWLFFYPMQVWELTFLPPQTKSENESDQDFARRVQVLTGEHVL